MSEKAKNTSAAKPVVVAKPAGKLVPRTAPKPAQKSATPAKDEVVAPPVAVAAAPVKAKPVRKPTQVQATVAKHQKVLADALVKAQAIKYDQPKVVKQESAKSAKPVKAAKPKKPKLVRDSFAMPESEYAQIAVLKKRLSALGSEVKKSELLRGGVALLAALNDAELKAVMGRVARIKTGRPAKK